MSPQVEDTEIPELYESGRNWRLIQLIVAGVILLAIIGLLVWYFFFKDTRNPIPTTPSVAPSSQNIGSGNSSDNGHGSTTPSTTTAPATSTANSQQNLSNTGPGNVIAIFIGTMIVGAAAYRLRARLANR